ncbi:alpha/beta fold hydrolase [Nocardioides terrisoli]|uniref:alpha/beta fold hydrolase n=1 Tax=Nocardioides terrisoli TaxID=3388267 RepID=UPI00287B99B1|nr:alpha/beta hydrolase [Nocardioides marmorisolisilvae]
MPEHTDDEIASVHRHAAELGVGLDPAAVRRVELDGGDVRVSGLSWGGDDPKVILLHGGGQNAHTWDRMLLTGTGPALALDLPGHGRSGWYPTPDYRPRRMAASLATAIGSLPAVPRVVVGMSLGGLAALALAAAHPDLARGLVLVDITPGNRPGRAGDLATLAETEVFADFEALLRHTRRYLPTASDASLERSLRYNAVRRDDGSYAWRADPRRWEDGRTQTERLFDEMASLWSEVALLQCPTTLVVAGDSPIVTVEDRQRMLRSNRRVRSVEIPRCGHNVQSDRPEALAAEVSCLLDT